MANRLILCDDTYINNNDIEYSKYLTPQAKTYVGVEIDPSKVHQLIDDIKTLRTAFNLPEEVTSFHFTDLYCKRQYWKDPDENKLETINRIFEMFTILFEKYQVETFLQTVESYTPVKGAEWPKGFLGKQQSTKEGTAFYLMVYNAIKNCQSGDQIVFLVEEGELGKPKQVYKYKWNGVLIAFYFYPKTYEPLQFADFVAFMITRAKIITLKNTMNYMDENIFMPLYERISVAINSKQVIKSYVPQTKHLKGSVEEVLEIDRKSKGLSAL